MTTESSSTIRHFPTLSNPAGLSMNELTKRFPSIFAEKASPKVSERYYFLSTRNIVEDLLKRDWIVTQAAQRSTRQSGRDPRFTRHMVRVRPAELTAKARKVGEVVPEVQIINAHDGQAKWRMYGGLFRLVCTNGLVVSMGTSDSLILRHVASSAELLGRIDEALEAAIGSYAIVRQMMKAILTQTQARAFALRAAELAYENKPDWDTSHLLEARREEDNGLSVWRVFNRVQENVIRGGQIITHRGTTRPVHLRGITHLGRSTDLNLGLWNLAVKAAA